MNIITRTIAINNLKKYIGKDLRDLALKYKITTYETGKQNKGWKGLILERLAGLETNISKAPNGLSWELKSVSFHEVKGKLTPKETMAISLRPFIKEASPVVDEPVNGSMTRSPLSVLAITILTNKSIGFCVGCLPNFFSPFLGG